MQDVLGVLDYEDQLRDVEERGEGWRWRLGAVRSPDRALGDVHRTRAERRAARADR